MKKLLFFFIIIVSSALSVHATGLWPKDESGLVKVQPLEGKNGSLVVYSKANEILQFFLFDVEGKLVRSTEIKAPQKTITGLEKGSYIYSVFKQDEEIDRGTVVIK